MSSTLHVPQITDGDRAALLTLARDSIAVGLRTGRPLVPQVADYAAVLQEHRASFVTLSIRGGLRGCIGSIVARRPLIEDVAANAFGAAFSDPRFDKLGWQEFETIDIEISLLSDLQPIRCSTEADLVRQLRPHIDGLTLQEGANHGALIPSAWKIIPDPAEFVRRLKSKAGLREDYWSENLLIKRFITSSFDSHQP